ncbi:LysR family transcriptional regulator, partial [Mesorhizobium sp. M4B.F.Ca.ET.172.01.1.1]
GSASLAGLRAAVDAGIALTPRTRRFAHSGIVEASSELDLPPLPMADFAIRLGREAPRSARDLAELLGSGLALPS